MGNNKKATSTIHKYKKCYINKCPIPENNDYYLWQVIFILIGFAFLIKDYTQFNALTIFVFVSPILLDLIYNDVLPTWVNVFRHVYIFLNCIIVFICFLGMSGIIIDTGLIFETLSTLIVFNNIRIPKSIFTILVMLNLGVPIMFWVGAPTKQTFETIDMIDNYMETHGRKM